MGRRDDREYRAIFEGGATQPAGMHRRPNAAGLSPRAVKLAFDSQHGTGRCKVGRAFSAAQRSTARMGFGLFLALACALPSAAQNLSSSSIDGTVTDQTGGALPGVTVTIASPALQVAQLATVS